MTIPKEKWGVHENHCCVFHGCKYGDDDCPVVTNKTTQKYSCEDCVDNEYFNPNVDPRIGIYKHFKGNIYELFEIGKDSDTLKEVAIYRSPEGAVWVRDMEEFESIHPEHSVKRFERI
jgi:hypothetical protein